MKKQPARETDSQLGYYWQGASTQLQRSLQELFIGDLRGERIIREITAKCDQPDMESF